jgi:hypothetical protein
LKFFANMTDAHSNYFGTKDFYWIGKAEERKSTIANSNKSKNEDGKSSSNSELSNNNQTDGCSELKSQFESQRSSSSDDSSSSSENKRVSSDKKLDEFFSWKSSIKWSDSVDKSNHKTLSWPKSNCKEDNKESCISSIKVISDHDQQMNINKPPCKSQIPGEDSKIYYHFSEKESNLDSLKHIGESRKKTMWKSIKDQEKREKEDNKYDNWVNKEQNYIYIINYFLSLFDLEWKNHEYIRKCRQQGLWKCLNFLICWFHYNHTWEVYSKELGSKKGRLLMEYIKMLRNGWDSEKMKEELK